MAQGRGGVGQTLTLGLTLLFLMLLHSELAESTIFNVGDDKGWTFNTQNWPKGKIFHAGDVLVFKFNPEMHNVVIVGQRKDFDQCTISSLSKIFKTGNDRFTLRKGFNFFACSIPGHCAKGMKIFVNAI